MPFPVAAAIAGGASIIGAGMNAASTGNMNKKNRKFAREQYATQRRDSLADWHMQNAYNSPEQQMARYKAAGLNPNLIYGHGTDANAVMPRQSEMPTPRTEAPQWGDALSEGAMGFLAGSKFNNQSDLLAQTLLNMEEERKLKIAQQLASIMGTAGKEIKNQADKIGLDFLRETYDTRLEQEREKVNLMRNQQRVMSADQLLKEQDYNIKEALRAPNLAMAVQAVINAKKDELLKDQDRILKGKQGQQMDAQTRNIKSDTAIKIHSLDNIMVQVENAIKDGRLKDIEIRWKDTEKVGGLIKDVIRMFSRK